MSATVPFYFKAISWVISSSLWLCPCQLSGLSSSLWLCPCQLSSLSRSLWLRPCQLSSLSRSLWLRPCQLISLSRSLRLCSCQLSILFSSLWLCPRQLRSLTSSLRPQLRWFFKTVPRMVLSWGFGICPGIPGSLGVPSGGYVSFRTTSRISKGGV